MASRQVLQSGMGTNVQTVTPELSTAVPRHLPPFYHSPYTQLPSVLPPATHPTNLVRKNPSNHLLHNYTPEQISTLQPSIRKGQVNLESLSAVDG